MKYGSNIGQMPDEERKDHCMYQTDKPGIFGRCGLTAVFGVLFDHWPIIQCCTVSTCVYAVYSFLIF